MQLVFFDITLNANKIFVPLVSLEGLPKEIIEHYGTGGLEFFPNAINTNKLNAFTSVDAAKKYIEQFKFENLAEKQIMINVDAIKEWLSAAEKEKAPEDIINLFGLIVCFEIFIHQNKIDFEQMPIICKIGEYQREKEIYDEFLENKAAGAYSETDLKHIDMPAPNYQQFNMLLTNPSLKEELKYIIELFESYLLIQRQIKPNHPVRYAPRTKNDITANNA